MALSADDEARGLKAYEQARAFERLRSWRLPVTFGACVALPVLAAALLLVTGHANWAWANFALAGAMGWMARFQWRQLQARHGRNLRLLAQMEAEHGEALPWVQVERHFAALEKLKRELAGESRQ